MGLVHNSVTTFNRALTAFAQEVGFTIEYAALREAALMCRDAIIFTPPFKLGGGGGGHTSRGTTSLTIFMSRASRAS